MLLPGDFNLSAFFNNTGALTYRPTDKTTDKIMSLKGDIINLNVGGIQFSTSRHTLTWIPDSFFTSMLGGMISTERDENGAIFIDRDPTLFGIILNFLRTKDIDVRNVNLRQLKHEAEFYGITPLIKRLVLCENLNHASCGNVLFNGSIPPPSASTIPQPKVFAREAENRLRLSYRRPASLCSEVDHPRPANPPPEPPQQPAVSLRPAGHSRSTSAAAELHRPLPGVSTCEPPIPLPRAHMSTTTKPVSTDLPERRSFRNPNVDVHRHHSRNSSVDITTMHANKTTADLDALLSHSSSSTNTDMLTDSLRVRIIDANHNWIAVAYTHFVRCYCLKEAVGWQVMWSSPYMEHTVERLALNAKGLPTNQSDTQQHNKMLAVSFVGCITLWAIMDEPTDELFQIGTFSIDTQVDALFFIGAQLVATSHLGKVGVWHSMSQHWQVQDVMPISSFDKAGSFLLLGAANGSIYYIDMQKFPLRMKDNDLLVTELYKDPAGDPITALSVYLTPKTPISGNWIETAYGTSSWIEIAYGTSSGVVRVIVQHPETVGHGPQLFQTFMVHRSPVTNITLSEKYLVSVCSEYNHVRTWTVTRFRGMISTQPGSKPHASFHIVTLEDVEPHITYAAGNHFGPYGEQDEQQVFIQKIVPETDQLYVRLSSNGKRVCVIKSVESSTITAFCVHECDGSSRMGSRPRRYIFTGHYNGSIQIWDLTTALELVDKGEEGKINEEPVGGPTPDELLNSLDQCDLSSSNASTPCMTPYGGSSSGVRLKSSNVVWLAHSYAQLSADAKRTK